MSECLLSDSPHALLEHRVTSSLADDDISPLHYYDTDKEGCVACELHNLPLLVCLWAGEERKVKSQILKTHQQVRLKTQRDYKRTHCCP